MTPKELVLNVGSSVVISSGCGIISGIFGKGIDDAVKNKAYGFMPGLTENFGEFLKTGIGIANDTSACIISDEVSV